MEEQTSFLGKQKVGKLIFKLAIPTIIAQIVNLLYNIVDRIYIGHIPEVGKTALTGVGVCMAIIIMVSALGEKKHQEAEIVVGNSFVMLIIIGVLLTIILSIFCEPLLYKFGASVDTIGFAKEYCLIYLIGSTFVMIALGMNAFITAQGFTKTSMITVLIGAILNCILDPIFIYAFNLGVKGAAIATVISQFASAIFTILFLTSDKSVLKLKFKNFKLNFKILLPCLLLGLSPFIMQFTEAIISICFNSSLQKYGGDIAVGSMTILSSLMQFSMLPIMGLSQGAQPVISYNYGAKSSSRVKQAFKILLISSLSYSVVLWLSLMLFPSGFAKIFTTDKELIEYTIWAIHIYFATSGLFGIQIACQQTFVAIGNAKVSLFLAVLRKILLLIPLIFFLPLICNNEVLGVLLAEPIADGIAVTVTGIAFLIIFTKTIKELDKNNLVNE